MPMRRTDVKLTRLRIGHTRFTHRHLLFGERAPECPSCKAGFTASANAENEGVNVVVEAFLHIRLAAPIQLPIVT
ncbi:hypothetical protein TNCV_4689461, partial [Trichonephila clavipes]